MTASHRESVIWIDGSCYPGRKSGAAALFDTGEFITTAVRGSDNNIAELIAMDIALTHKNVLAHSSWQFITDSRYVYNLWLKKPKCVHGANRMRTMKEYCQNYRIKLKVRLIPKSKNCIMQMRLVDNLARLTAQTQVAMRGVIPWVQEEHRCKSISRLES